VELWQNMLEDAKNSIQQRHLYFFEAAPACRYVTNNTAHRHLLLFFHIYSRLGWSKSKTMRIIVSVLLRTENPSLLLRTLKIIE